MLTCPPAGRALPTGCLPFWLTSLQSSGNRHSMWNCFVPPPRFQEGAMKRLVSQLVSGGLVVLVCPVSIFRHLCWHGILRLLSGG